MFAGEEKMSKSLEELADFLGGTLQGDPSIAIHTLGSLDDAEEGQITFLANPKYAAKVATTRASAVVLPPGAESYGRPAIRVTNPYLAFAKLLTLFQVRQPSPMGVMDGALLGEKVVLGSDITIYPGAYVGNNVTIGSRSIIHPGAVIYDNVTIGDDTVIHANVSVRESCRIGSRVIIHCGAVIGADGFGYAPDGDGWFKIPQVGIVIIGNDVEIGANTAVDRAALATTVIGSGTKIDNLVQIAHNCQLGENCMIVAQVGIAGSSRLGRHVTIGGQAALSGHITLGDNVMVGGQSGVTEDVPAGTIVSGTPAFPHRDWLKASRTYPKLPEMRKTLNSLEKRLEELEAALAKNTSEKE
jgi:UDP-3-O-[3-hydroxymyristoyl] glucosamine N-acyltransferase